MTQSPRGGKSVNMASNSSVLERKLSVYDCNSRPPRNTARPTSRRGRTCFKRPQSHLERCWTEYCQSTALHGIRYFVGERRTVFERLFWVVCVTVCLVVSVVLICKVYHSWESSPPILSVAEPTPTWKVPFPAVSICPRNKTVEFGLQLCNASTPTNCVGVLIAATPLLSDVVRDCSWNGVPLAVDHRTFPRVLSDDGMCYTFNMLPTSDIFSDEAAQHAQARPGNCSSSPASRPWTLEDGYPADAARDVHPRRAVDSRVRSGLSLTMRSDNRFKIVLHSPMDPPLVNLAENYVFKVKESAAQSMQQFTFFPVPDEEAAVGVTPTLTRSSSSLLRVDPHRRRCYFPSERPLRFYRAYTQRNCELECVANHTTRACGCAPIYMPRPANQSACRRLDCVARATKDCSNIDCDCLPTCSSVGYHFRVDHYSWRRESDREPTATRAELDKWARLSRISVQVKGTTMTAISRTESYSRPEFIADCGGLLGLFSGFSIITFVEVLFHLIIKWLCYIFKRNQ